MTLKLDSVLQILRDPDCPRVLTTSELTQWFVMHGIVLAEATQKRWITRMRDAGLIQTVRRGLYLNLLAQTRVQPDEAASHICRGAIVSLQKVLGDVGVLNNFTSWVTCVVPLPPEKLPDGKTAFGFARPSTGKVATQGGVFTFQAMPFDLIHSAGTLDDRLQPLPYLCATPEKAFLDWLYLGASPRSPMTPPPLDLEFGRLNQARLSRLASAMGLKQELEAWQSKKKSFDQATGTQANAPRG